ncbi:MAG: hypothetical protein LBE92_03785 [Chryseobacterium sp.]|jgi:hypothetical protein|uniref:hypothetical protein n=1 Tax=Chryseobacterium sp. TaxID=1871047 RepID=UPI00281E6C18|nr:hypothetical protein [Chryseobacterium sp.]MDR2235222.1 hypothetical protein [Chryseobacterium sp.]
MKKLMLIMGGVLVLVGIGLYHIYDWDVYLMNKMNRSVLPEKYKSYGNINTAKPIVFGQHEMKLMWDESFEPIQHFINSKGEVIVMTSEIPTDRDQEEVKNDASAVHFYQDFHFYKLDSNGEVKDHYVFKRTRENGDEKVFGDFIVNEDQKYYRTWIADGDTLAKPIIIQNENLTWDTEKQAEVFNKIFEEAEYFNNADHNYPGQKTTYYRDGKWYQLFTNAKLRERMYNRRKPQRFNNLFRHYSSLRMEMTNKSFPQIVPVYFQRTELVKLTHSIGGGSVSSTARNWKGDLYCELGVDKDTLKFKVPIMFEEDFTTQKFYETSGEKIGNYKAELEKQYSPYYYFTDKNLNFQLFTTSDSKLYLIRKTR